MRLASRGLRDMDSGPEVIQDAAELATIRTQAARVHRHAALLAFLLTLMAVLLP